MRDNVAEVNIVDVVVDVAVDVMTDVGDDVRVVIGDVAVDVAVDNKVDVVVDVVNDVGDVDVGKDVAEVDVIHVVVDVVVDVADVDVRDNVAVDITVDVAVDVVDDVGNVDVVDVEDDVVAGDVAHVVVDCALVHECRVRSVGYLWARNFKDGGKINQLWGIKNKASESFGTGCLFVPTVRPIRTIPVRTPKMAGIGENRTNRQKTACHFFKKADQFPSAGGSKVFWGNHKKIEKINFSKKEFRSGPILAVLKT